MKFRAILFLSSIFLTSCATISGGMAPSSIPLEPGKYQELGPVKAQDCVYYILGLIPTGPGNNTQKAFQYALQQQPNSDALIEISTDSFSQYFVVFTRTCTLLQGKAVRKL